MMVQGGGSSVYQKLGNSLGQEECIQERQTPLEAEQNHTASIKNLKSCRTVFKLKSGGKLMGVEENIEWIDATPKIL